MKFFVKIKAWQLFAVLLGPVFAVQFVAMWADVEKSNPIMGFVLVPLIMLVFWAVLLGWLWTLGTKLSKKVPEELRMRPGSFRFAIVYSAICLPCMLGLFSLSGWSESDNALSAFFMALHLFLGFCMFYTLYFVSKNLTMAERREKVTFYDFAGPFFLLIYFPLGVWFIQPRVNRMFESESDT